MQHEQISAPIVDTVAVRDVRKPEGREEKLHSPPSVLPAYEVQERAFSDFGMSVKTNFDVKWGGEVEWMIVTDVALRSSAAVMGVRVGDRILAIDAVQVTTLTRDAMLDILFHRKKADRSRFLLLGEKESLPRFVWLVAARG